MVRDLRWCQAHLSASGQFHKSISSQFGGEIKDTNQVSRLSTVCSLGRLWNGNINVFNIRSQPTLLWQCATYSEHHPF
jgi:hypothetical protein